MTVKERLHYIWRVFAERHDQAWIDGYRDGEEEVQEAFDAKDAFIEGQAEIITRLIEVVRETDGWRAVPDDLYEALRDYV